MLNVNFNASNALLYSFKERVSISLSNQQIKILAIVTLALSVMVTSIYLAKHDYFVSKETKTSDGKKIHNGTIEGTKYLDGTKENENENEKEKETPLSLPASTIFIGNLINGKLEGEGKKIYNKNDIEEGTFKNGLLIKGKITTNDEIRIGTFVNGELEGQGRKEEIFEHHIYEGTFKNNALNGQGKFTSLSQIEEGEFIQNFLNGKGQITYLQIDSEHLSEHGNFFNSRLNGEGIRHYRTGKSNILSEEGSFSDGLLDGQGIRKYQNGTEQNGSFIKGEFQG